MDALAVLYTAWKRATCVPKQDVLNIMSAIPKKDGKCILVASMASAWQLECKEDAAADRERNRNIAV